jgi:carbamoylphosphate synthase large subunit
MPTILCLASYFKGGAFLAACKREDCHVILLTKESLADEPWPWEAIDERYLMPELSKQPDMLYSVSYLARNRKIDRIIPLDDFDVETAAALREHLRLPGLGETATRYFRDKLAMRQRAEEHGIRVPRFCRVINYDDISNFTDQVPPPWVLKPRSQAGAMGIKKIHHKEELWRILEELGDRQSFFLLEEFIPGDIYHVDSIVSEGSVLFSEVHKYRQPPMAVSHEGGVFISRTVPRGSSDETELTTINGEVVIALGMIRGVNHTEFIRGDEDGELYFLETAARVGGANIAEMVEFATGINLWSEWAAIELSNLRNDDYELPDRKYEYAAVMICLSRQEHPDLSQFNDPEVVWHLDKKFHAGLILSSSNQARIEQLLDLYSERFINEFLAFAPPLDEAPI